MAQTKAYSTDPMLKKLGRKINKSLADTDRSVEWLSFESDTARSTLREIIAGRSNPRILTVKRIASALGYKNVEDFLKSL